MNETKHRELQAVRTEVAVKICVSYPSLYRKIFSKTPIYSNEKERCAADVLKAMLRLEPSVKHILDFHYKREMR